MKPYKERILTILFIVGVFISILVFFSSIHPITLFDTDDWNYACYHRTALPLWKNWNPIRVFPEIFMPIVTMIGAYVVNPIIKDYFFSLTICYAVAVSLAFTILIYMLYEHFKKQIFKEITILFFIICHFWIFRVLAENNDYMLRTNDASTYFFYVIPNLLNCVMVLWTLNKSVSKCQDNKKYIKNSLSVFLVYFCIFSNIWASIILASYTGSILLLDIIGKLKKNELNLISYCKEHIRELMIMIVWALSQIFELSGGRATSLVSDSYMESLKQTLEITKGTFASLNSAFVVVSLIIIVVGTGLIIRNRQWSLCKNILLMAISLLINILYLFLSCAKAGSAYLSRPDVFYGCFFFGMMINLYCMSQIIDTIPKICPLLPLLLSIAFVECNTSGRTFRESNIGQLPSPICKDVCDDIMNQFLEAEDRGDRQVTIYVPLFGNSSGDNWPIATYATTALSDHFYKMGIVKNRIYVKEIVPSIEKNRELNLN